MTDGRIARLTCTATVIAGTGDEGRAVALAENLLRTTLSAALPEALGSAFADDPAVYLARFLHCEVTAGPGSDGTLARSIAARLAGALRAPDPDGADLIRFPTIASYHAAFLAAHVSGDARDRWYFGPLRHLAALPPPAAFQALAADGHDMGAVLLALRQSGALPGVMTAAGEQALARTWPTAGSARASQQEWLSLARLALDLARALGWAVTRWEAGAAQAGSARSGAPDLVAVAATLAGQARQAAQHLDWTDPVALASALARATRLLASPGPASSRVTASQLPPWLDWADTPTLLAALAAPPQPPSPAGATEEAGTTGGPLPPRQAAGHAPRTAAIDALLTDLITAGAVVLDPRYPVASAIALWTAVADRMPELAEAAWPRHLVSRYVRQALSTAGQLADPVRPATQPPRSQARSAATRVDCAGIYLLLRTLDAIRMPRLCSQCGIPPAALLHRLARRWSAPAVSGADIAAALRPLTGDDLPGSRPGTAAWQRLHEMTLAAALAQLGAAPGIPVPATAGPPTTDSTAALAHAHDLDREIRPRARPDGQHRAASLGQVAARLRRRERSPPPGHLHPAALDY